MKELGPQPSASANSATRAFCAFPLSNDLPNIGPADNCVEHNCLLPPVYHTVDTWQSMQSLSREKKPAEVAFGGFTQSSGGEGSRTLDLCIANAALSQLSYAPGCVRNILAILFKNGSRNAVMDTFSCQVAGLLWHAFVTASLE
jgi:hypothetical protein